VTETKPKPPSQGAGDELGLTQQPRL